MYKRDIFPETTNAVISAECCQGNMFCPFVQQQLAMACVAWNRVILCIVERSGCLFFDCRDTEQNALEAKHKCVG